MVNPETTFSPLVAKAAAQDVCASDPNFALIFAFWERFGECCGVTIPTFQELQDMLGKTDEVPDVLVDLHIKLLRRVKKSVHVDKWEKAIFKFCQTYSIPEFWELEHYGYKGISVQLKLRILKTLFEAQFDSNPKFKAEINKLESSTLRSQPLGWDKSGVAYWVQFDRAYNIRVYKEDIDEDIWKIVANDRNTLVNLINELSGAKDSTLDDIEDSNSIETSSDAEVELSPGLDQEKYSPGSPNTASIIENKKVECSINESTIKLPKQITDSKEKLLENPFDLKKEIDEDNGLQNKINNPIVGEIIEESVMIVKGEGSGQECDTGNPDETKTQNETSKNEDVKKPKLWSIEAICSSSKEVREENISVPTTGFFFGDDSVPCFNNISNGESSYHDEEKLEVDQLKENDDKLNAVKKLDEVDSSASHIHLDEIDVSKTSHNDISLKSECTKNEEESSIKSSSKQSVFNIKVHEEEVQITEQNANDVITKSEFNIKNDNHKPNIYESTLEGSHDKPQESQLKSMAHIFEINDNNRNKTDKFGTDNDIQENKIIEKHNVNEEVTSEKVENESSDQQLPNDDFDNVVDKQIIEQKNLSMKLEDETEQQLTSKIDNSVIDIDKHILDDRIKIIDQTTSKVNESNEKEKIDDSCKKNKANESPANIANLCANVNEAQNVDVIEQNLSLNKTISDDLDDTTTNNQILTGVSNIIEKEIKSNSVIEDSKIDEPISEDISKHIQTTDSNYTLNQNTESNNLTLNTIDCSSSKIHDQTVVEVIDQSFKIGKQDANQNSKINKKTLHNIRNIIETDKIVISDNTEDSEQLTSTIDNENRQLENYQIKNENNFKNNIFQEQNKLVGNVDYQIVSSNKHSEDKMSEKSEEIIQEISECNTFEKEITELKDKPQPSIVSIETDKICIEKSDVNIKEFKDTDTSNDLIEIKKEVKLPEDEIKDKNVVSSIQKQQEFIDTVDEIPKGHNIKDDSKSNDKDELSDISMKQYNEDKIKEKYSEMSYKDIKSITKETKPNNKKEKHKLIITENETNVCFEEKLKLEELKTTLFDKENSGVDLIKRESTSTTIEATIIDIENSKETLQNDEKVNTDTDMKKILKIKDLEKIYTRGPEEENIIKKSVEQTVTSPVHEDIYENVDETNEETFIGRLEEGIDDSNMLELTIEEHTKINDEVEEKPKKKKGRPGRKKGKRGKAKKTSAAKQRSNTEEKAKRSYKPRQKKVVTITEEVKEFPEPVVEDNIRRSRRIAEIKIKEQFIPTTHYDDIDEPIKSLKKKDKAVKKVTTTKKLTNADESNDEDDPTSKKFRKKKKKIKSDSLKKLNMKNPWNVDSEASSSEKDIGLFEDYDHEEEEEIPRPGIEPNVSDHEFSPESDINDEDEEYLPEKRARTAHKKDHGEQLKDDMACRNCNKSDQPEWILLCDTCNQGWHASCLRPPLMVIPDGDWYCPPCRHNSLLNALKDVLKKFDAESKKRENEELRRKRLAYVGISLQNVITSKTEEVKTVKQPVVVVHESSEDNEQSGSESYDSEPLYQLRARRQANVSYRFNDYDDMINEAILETGVDEYKVKKSAELKTGNNDDDNDDDDEKSDSDENDRSESPIAPALLHLRGRKKSKKLTNLDVSSDDGSDEDFKGPSDGDDDYEEDFSEYSDDSVKRPQPTRRSVRNRKTVVDPDFINDDSSEDSDRQSKKKRSRPWSDSSNSEEDFTWGRKKKKRTNAPSTSSFSIEQPKGSKRKRSQNFSILNPKKSKVKYGMDSDSDSYGQPQRRTRGRQITYAESDDSEEEITTKKRKVADDEEDEYVLNDEELEIENEDHNFEVDDDDIVASNDEKDDDDDDDDDDNNDNDNDNDEEAEEEAEVGVVEEEEEDVEKDNPKPATTVIAQRMTTVVQSVIKEPMNNTKASVINLAEDQSSQNVHQRLLPSMATKAAARDNKQIPPPLPPHLPIDPVIVGTPDNKRKRPSNQMKKSPNPSVDYGGGSGNVYSYPPGTTNVVSAVPTPLIQVTYNRPPVVSVGGLKLIPAVTDPPPPSPSSFPGVSSTYRIGNKITATPVATTVPTPSTYQLSPQVQVYNQTAPLSSANYSPYPIEYVTSGASLPPPPPTIAFRNVVVAPPSLTSHEPPLLSTPQQQQQHQHQQQSINIGTAATGDSEFGGLVSYFSSQQEDDFDT